MTEDKFYSTIEAFPFKFDYVETHDLLGGGFLGIASKENVIVYYQSDLSEYLNSWMIRVYNENTHENLEYENTAKCFVELFTDYHKSVEM